MRFSVIEISRVVFSSLVTDVESCKTVCKLIKFLDLKLYSSFNVIIVRYSLESFLKKVYSHYLDDVK